jgi:hypothetical protein
VSIIEKACAMHEPTNMWCIDADGYWLVHNGALRELRNRGYSIDVHETVDRDYMYVLTRSKEVLLETKDMAELNRAVNLILPPRATKGENT